MSTIVNAIKKNRVLKAGMGYTIGNYFLKGINFLTVPIFTRLMSTSDYGTYSIYMTYDSIISIFIAFALHSSLKNAKYKYKEKFDEYVSSILILPVIFLTFLLLLVNLFGQQFSSILDLNRFVINILFCHAFSNAIVTIYNGKLGIDYRYKNFLKISFFNTAMNLMLSIALMYTMYANERYLGRILGSAMPLLLIAVYIYWKTFSISKPKINLDFWKFGLNYSIPIIPHGLAQVVLSSFDRIMIKSIIGVSQAGIYSLGVNIEALVKVTTTSLDTVWGPWFYERMSQKDYKGIKQYSSYYIYGMFVLLGCLMIAAPELVMIMGPEQYQDAKYVVIPLLNCTFFTFLYTIPSSVEYYFQKTKMIALGTICAALLNIILNSIFIRKFGYIAAAYTTLVSYALYFVFHYLIAKSIVKRQLFNTKVILGCITGILLINVLGLWTINHFFIRLIFGVVFLGINCLFAWKKILPNVIKKK